MRRWEAFTKSQILCYPSPRICTPSLPESHNKDAFFCSCFFFFLNGLLSTSVPFIGAWQHCRNPSTTVPRGIPSSEALSGGGSPSAAADWMNGNEYVWGWKHALLPCYDVLSNNLTTKASILKWSYDGAGLLRSSRFCIVPLLSLLFVSPAVCFASEIRLCCGWLRVVQQPVYCLSAKADSLWEGL